VVNKELSGGGVVLVREVVMDETWVRKHPLYQVLWVRLFYCSSMNKEWFVKLTDQCEQGTCLDIWKQPLFNTMTLTCYGRLKMTGHVGLQDEVSR
jgi:hypothetical protein